MKHPVDTAYYAATQLPGQRFDASLREGWGVWISLLGDDILKAVFTRRADADGYVAQQTSGGQRGQVRRMWLVLNETTGEAYALGCDGNLPVHGVDLDFSHRAQLDKLRSDVLSRLSEAELKALGLKRI
ncbi:hypothetical protein [Acidovorax sp. LjRoot194]|uniref:hypothetical protein n=1 Tax=Acidovorax sp. LjRoot194 TaxID=3342280 RepID=UPI003ED0D5F4